MTMPIRMSSVSILLAFACLGWTGSVAAEPAPMNPQAPQNAQPGTQAAKPPVIEILQLDNPNRSTGLQVGDLLERRLLVKVAQPYQLAASALPLKGELHDGIELADIHLEKQAAEAATLYTLSMRYQVFATATTPAILQLPAMQIALNGGPEALTIKVPAWRFWFSPLAVADIRLAKAALQPQAPPSPLPLSEDYLYLAVAIGLLIAGLGGLIYVHAEGRWLPFMGGAFARAYRQIRRLPRSPQHETQALLRLHQAFDQVYGASLFTAGIDDFIAGHPQFRPARDDIATFFSRSGQRLFSGRSTDARLFDELLALARRLRHCERGLA